jgi:hypothetical protein
MRARRALCAAAGVLGLAGALAWGCATTPAPRAAQQPAHDWQHYEPDGGWAGYVPSSAPSRATSAADPPFNVTPVTPQVNETTLH